MQLYLLQRPPFFLDAFPQALQHGLQTRFLHPEPSVLIPQLAHLPLADISPPACDLHILRTNFQIFFTAVWNIAGKRRFATLSENGIMVCVIPQSIFRESYLRIFAYVLADYNIAYSSR